MIPEQRREHVVDQVEVSVGRGELLLHCRDCAARQVVRLEDPTFDVRVSTFLRSHPQVCRTEIRLPQELPGAQPRAASL